MVPAQSLLIVFSLCGSRTTFVGRFRQKTLIGWVVTVCDINMLLAVKPPGPGQETQGLCKFSLRVPKPSYRFGFVWQPGNFCMPFWAQNKGRPGCLDRYRHQTRPQPRYGKFLPRDHFIFTESISVGCDRDERRPCNV